jgi:hypothetical protein
MGIRWRRILPMTLPVALMAIAFSVYVSSRPTTYCVIVNERLQKTIKASGKRCTELSSEEEAVVFTRDGVYGVGDGL